MPIPDYELAQSIVREFVKLSYNAASWEKLISLAKLQPYGCLIDALAIECPIHRRKEVAFYAANALRRGRFQSLTRGRAEWERKIWTDEEINAVIQIVQTSVRTCLDRQEPQLKVSRSMFIPPTRSAGESGIFVPWRLFCDREPVAEAEGVYVFAYFEEEPEQVVDPTCKDVIYIGVTAGQTLRMRLRQFEDTALGGSGHSGGWSYRIDYFADDWEKLQTFHNTYVTWIVVSNGGIETPGQVEYRLKNIEYAKRWGRLPKLNKV